MEANTPWLTKKSWAKNRIGSNAKLGMYTLIIFSIVWWAVILVLFLNRAEILKKFEDEPFVALVLIIPLAGLPLLYSTYKSIKQWKKLGATPLILDPFPGSIGGHVGGFIETNIPYNSNLSTKVELQCIYSYISGSGKNRSRSQRIEWQKEGVCHTDISTKGSRFKFRFDTPENLPEADIKRRNTYYFWQLQITNSDKEIKLNRQFDIPVFATSQQSKTIQADTETYQSSKDNAVNSIEKIARITEDQNGITAFFPAFQRPAKGMLMGFIGIVFSTFGIFSFVNTEMPMFFALIFSIIGIPVTLSGLHYLGKSLRVQISSDGITTRRFIFGMPIATKHIAKNEFGGFKEKNKGTMQTNNKTTTYYQLLAKNKIGNNLVIAERLNRQSEINILKEIFERHIQT